MGQFAELSFKFHQKEKLPDVGRTERWRGCSAQFVRLSQQSSFAFFNPGHAHYLAIHDIVLADGWVRPDGHDPVRMTDLRDTLTYTPPGCTAHGWAVPNGRVNAFTALYFDPDEMALETDGLVVNRDNRPLLFFRCDYLAATMRRLQTLMDHDDEPDPILCETLALTAAVEISLRPAGTGTPPAIATGRFEERMKLVRDYVEANLALDITLGDMAGIAGLSRYRFLRQFKAYTGDTPHRFVQRRRTERAKQMLHNADMPDFEIASATGFGSTRRFARSFRALTGTTPSAWRRLTD